MIVEGEGYSEKHMTLMHKTIKKVSEDYEAMKFNTAIAAMMSFVNEVFNDGFVTRDELKSFVTLLNPVAPHATEEIWEEQNFGGMLNKAEWPVWDENKTVDDVIELPVQISGKVRGKIIVSKDADVETARKLATDDENINKYLDGKSIVKEVYVAGKIYNIVVK
jgi:leucyl-tRNA synthetase